MTIYSETPTDFSMLIAPFPAPIQDLAAKLRALILQTLPQLTETVSGGKTVGNALYSLNTPNDVLCGIQPNEQCCKLFIHFYDSVKNMGFKIEGSGKNARHIKFFPDNNVPGDELVSLLNTIYQNSGY